MNLIDFVFVSFCVLIFSFVKGLFHFGGRQALSAMLSSFSRSFSFDILNKDTKPII